MSINIIIIIRAVPGRAVEPAKQEVAVGAEVPGVEGPAARLLRQSPY